MGVAPWRLSMAQASRWNTAGIWRGLRAWCRDSSATLGMTWGNRNGVVEEDGVVEEGGVVKRAGRRMAQGAAV